MLQKLPTSLKAVLFSFCLTSTYAAEISFSGQTEFCPGQDYTYTASASNIFGPRNGSFEWTFWRDNQLIGSFGAPIAACPAQPGTSTSTVTFNWGTVLGPVKIRIRFKGVNDPLCHFNSPDVKWVDVNVRVLSPGPISGLVFCSPNETRTLSVPGILPFNQAQSCYFHHKYDWIVPNGWSVIPTGGQPFTAIENGIRTFATSVLVSAPSTPLAPRYDGNYNVIVRTEPAWPYPTESTGKIWVGTPDSPTGTLRGNTTPSQGSIERYWLSPYTLAPGATSHTWWLPYNAPGCNPCWSVYSQGDPYNMYANVGQESGYVQVIGTNVCGLGGAKILYVTPQTGGGGVIQMVAYPNPASSSLTIEPTESSLTIAENEGETDNSQNLNQFSAKLLDKNNSVIKSGTSKEGRIIFDIQDLKDGIYYLHITRGKELITKQILITK